MKPDPIQALIDEWERIDIRPMFRLDEIKQAYAKYLNCWQQIVSDDPSTWPNVPREILLQNPTGTCEVVMFSHHSYAIEWHGCKWRYFGLLPIDRPPVDEANELQTDGINDAQIY